MHSRLFWLYSVMIFEWESASEFSIAIVREKPFAVLEFFELVKRIRDDFKVCDPFIDKLLH